VKGERRERRDPVALVRSAGNAMGRRQATISTLLGSHLNLVLVAISAIVLLPLYVRTIEAELYGAWLASGEVLVWLLALDLGLPNLLIQRVGAAHARGDHAEIGRWFWNGALALGVIALVVFGIGVAVAFALPRVFSITGADALRLRGCFIVCAAATALTLAGNAIVGLARGIQRTASLSVVTVVGTAAGLLVSLVLVLADRGLWAIAGGVATRTIVVVGGGLVFVVWAMDGEMRRGFVADRTVLRELASISPSTGAGGLAYALMTQTEVAIVATLASPAAAVSYAMTRKAADLGRLGLDAVGVAAYGSFAHLVHSDEKSRALEVHTALRRLRSALAVGVAAGYVAVNTTLLRVWVGEKQDAGILVTLAFGAALITTGDAYLLNALYRASGPVARGSMALVVEAAVRVPLFAVLLIAGGLAAAPMAAVLTGTVSAIVIARWTRARLAGPKVAWPRVPVRVWGMRGVALGGATALGFLVTGSGWPYVLVVGGVIASVTIVALVGLDPVLGIARARGWLRT